MPVFMRYLMSLIFHMMWSRIGKGAPAPPLRVPRRGTGPAALPSIAPWQMVIAMWTLNKMWDKFGNDVKSRLLTTNNSTAKGIGSLLPDPKGDAGSTPKVVSAGNATTVVNAPSVNAPATPAASPAPPITPHMSTHAGGQAGAGSPAPSHDTQPLTSARLPHGSVLSRLRGAPALGQTPPSG